MDENNENNEGFFVRQLGLEPYFKAIKSNPIVSIVSSKLDKKTKMVVPQYDTSYFSPQIISYCFQKGFYPICLDGIHNKLVIVINQEYDFSVCDYGKVFTDGIKGEDIVTVLMDNFSIYFPEFFSSLIPSSIHDMVSGIYDVEFKLVTAEIFGDLFPYVIDPRKIDEYNAQKDIADSKDHGLFLDDSSIAGEILDSILTYAVLHRGTDVHLEYTGERYVARIRIDGELTYYPKDIPSKYYSAMISIIRTRADLDITEHFKGQDGQMQFESQFVEKGKVNSAYDLRISIIPDVNGKMNVVLRIQQKGEFKTLDQLGFNHTVYDKVKTMCKEPHGMILVTGPTGSGKTTTLYSILNELNKEDVKVLTCEDPVEIKMVGITQISINEKQGRTFPTMLRHFLRHDPDIILVGEIRDVETAKIAINASNTGHLVLSTLHTNDAAASIKRLSNMDGIEPAEFAFALKGICAQRLIKTFNKAIIDGIPKGEPEATKYMLEHNLFRVDVGDELNKIYGETIFPINRVFGVDGTRENFEGRTAITEFWKLGPKAQELIFGGKFSTATLIDVAIKEDGMLPMPVTGVEKIINLETSLDNLIKVVGLDSIYHCRYLLMDMFFC